MFAGEIVALLLAYAARFIALAFCSVDSELQRIKLGITSAALSLVLVGLIPVIILVR